MFNLILSPHGESVNQDDWACCLLLSAARTISAAEQDDPSEVPWSPVRKAYIAEHAIRGMRNIARF